MTVCVSVLCNAPSNSSFTLSSAQVDEQSVFRHRGERKVKTVEEGMEEVTSGTADLLEEEEELIGSMHDNTDFI